MSAEHDEAAREGSIAAVVRHVFREEEDTLNGERITVTYSPYYDLMGVVAEQEDHTTVDAVQLRTLNRVLKALGEIQSAVERALPPASQGPVPDGR